MGLETATYISQLVATNPLGTDPKSQGDNHLQLIKGVLQTQFPNFGPAAMNASVVELNYSVGLTGLIQTQLDNKVTALNAALTGIPTAPTASIGTNTTQIATTAFVINQVATGTTPAGPGDAGKFWYYDGASYSWRYSGNRTRDARSSNTILVAADLAKIIDLTAGFTQTLTAAATLGNGWWVELNNAGNQDQIIDPNGAETIDGASTYTLKAGWRVLLLCNGTSFTTAATKRRTYSGPVLVTGSGTLTVPADTYVIRAYAVGAGSAGSTTARGAGGGMAYGDIAVTPGQTVTFTISGGIAKVTTSAVDRLTGNPASGVTAGTAAIDASVFNGGNPSGGAGAAAIGAGASSGSPIGAGVAGAAGNAGGSGWGGAGGTLGGGGTGGVGGSSPNSGLGGVSVSLTFPSTEPLLAILNGGAGFGLSTGTENGGRGGNGAGGGGNNSGNTGGMGGIGGGGGRGDTGGTGGFGGGGGAGAAANGGAGGFGGGGGYGVSAGGAGGAAAIMYFL